MRKEGGETHGDENFVLKLVDRKLRWVDSSGEWL